jgi:hypothetical protein
MTFVVQVGCMSSVVLRTNLARMLFEQARIAIFISLLYMSKATFSTPIAAFVCFAACTLCFTAPMLQGRLKLPLVTPVGKHMFTPMAIITAL